MQRRPREEASCRAGRNALQDTLPREVAGFNIPIGPYRGTPVAYAGESSKRSGSGIVAISSAKKIDKVLGAGKHTPIKFVDDLATINYEDERSAGSCTYVDLDTRERFNVKLTAQDQTVTLYERRTGRQVAKKRFKAPRPRCDKSQCTTLC